MKTLLALGIMSGTSIDGVDFALCAVSRGRIKLRRLRSVRFPVALRRGLQSAAAGAASSWDAGQLHHDLGRFYAREAIRSTKGAGIDVAGLHGQTIFHQPGKQFPATFQLGEPAYLARALGVPVVNNFRAADLAAGGQGAPLATLFHLEVFGRRGSHVCVQNLGGIGNVTSIDWRGTKPRVLAFDTGPANVLLDLAMRHFSNGRLSLDRDGRRASRGRASERLLERWLRHPYFLQPPPKSTGRELFGESFFNPALRAMTRARMSENDMLATFSELTARSISLNYSRHLPAGPKEIILAGGGALNSDLRRRMERAFEKIGPSTSIVSCADRGWPPQSIEPAAFALLAARRLEGRPGNLPETTGAESAVLCGQLTEI
jgi:anhydro-N-acetylmuramic acid kinase